MTKPKPRDRVASALPEVAAPEVTGASNNPLVTIAPERPLLDPHGFDASAYDWIPVKRKRRTDGWSHERQREFIGHLADEGSVAEAARLVDMTVQSCYRLRRAPDAQNFARAWDAAIGEAHKRLLDVAMERATLGAEVAVFNKDGVRIATRRRPSDRLLIYLLNKRLGDTPAEATAEREERTRDAPALPSVAEAIVALEPAQLAAPQLTMSAERLTDEIEVAELGDGELPHWLRDAPELEPLTKGKRAPVWGEEFERKLEEAKNGTYKTRRKSKRAFA